MRHGVRFTVALLVVLSVATGCVGPKKRYRELWVGMEQSLVEQAYRGKRSKPSTIVFTATRGRSKIGTFRMSCHTYGRTSGYSETVCIEGGVLAAKGFLHRLKPPVATLVQTTPNELLVSSRVADDRDVEIFELNELRDARLHVGGTEVWRLRWRLVEPVPLGVDPGHAWDTRDESANLRAFESIDLGMTEEEVERLPFFRGFPERIVYFFLTAEDRRMTRAHISRCELHGHVSYCIEDDRVVAKGLPTWREWEGKVLVVEADFAAKLGLEGSEWVSYKRSVIDCTGLPTGKCKNLVGWPGSVWDILRIERR